MQILEKMLQRDLIKLIDNNSVIFFILSCLPCVFFSFYTAMLTKSLSSIYCLYPGSGSVLISSSVCLFSNMHGSKALLSFLNLILLRESPQETE